MISGDKTTKKFSLISPVKLGSFFFKKSSSVARPLETECLLSLANESYRVGKEMLIDIEKQFEELYSSSPSKFSVIELPDQWKILLKQFLETEIVWQSVLKVLKEEKESSQDTFTNEREEMLQETMNTLQKITINIQWIQLLQLETIAAIAFEKIENDFTISKTSELYEKMVKQAMNDLLQVQHAWKRLFLSLPYPEQVTLWNQRFESEINYSDFTAYTFRFWSSSWKTALKCRYETMVEMKKLKEASNQLHQTQLQQKGHPHNNSNNNLLLLQNPSTNAILKTEYSLDKLKEYKNSEEIIWDELIKTCQTIRLQFSSIESLNPIWKIIFQEIEFQKCLTLVERSSVGIEILKYQINSYSSYPLIKYSITKMEKKRTAKDRTFIDIYEALQVIGADVKKIEQMCLLWQELKEELKLLDEYSDNTVQLYTGLKEIHPNSIDEQEDALLQRSPHLLLASIKWKASQAERLLQSIEKPVLLEDNQTEDTQTQSSSISTCQWSEVEQLKLRIRDLCGEVHAALEKNSFYMWRPDNFPIQKLQKLEQIVDISIIDYFPTTYDVVPMKVFLEMVNQFSEIRPYKAELEEILLGVPDQTRKIADSVEERIQSVERRLDSIILSHPPQLEI